MSEQKEISIKSLDEYTQWVEKIQQQNKGRYAFRGQANFKWSLNASALRRLRRKKSKGNYADRWEIDLFVGYLDERIHEVRMQFPDKYGRDRNVEDLEVMSDLQHYGGATGLIDFSLSPLAALWFACKEEKGVNEERVDGKVFAINLEKIEAIKTRNELAGDVGKFFNPNKAKKTNESVPLYAWSPGREHARMIAQQSLFIFGLPEIERKHIADECIIAQGAKNRIIDSLKSMGVSEETVFPDFHGFAAANAPGKHYELKGTVDYYERAVSNDPKDPHSHFQLGNIRCVLGDCEGGIKDFNQAIKLKPDYSSAYFSRGNARIILGETGKAINDLDEAIKLTPNYVLAYLSRGNAQVILGKSEEAIRDFNKVLELDPDNRDVYGDRGNAKGQLKEPEDAIKDLDKAIELNSDDPLIYLSRGNVQVQLEKFEEAIKDYNRAMELNPNDTDVYICLGMVKHKLGMDDEALKNFDKAIELNPSDSDFYFFRGDVKKKTGDFDGARSDLQAAEKLAENQGNEELAAQVAKLLSELEE